MLIVNPAGTTDAAARALARRRPSLAGCRVGVLDNSKPNAGALLGRLADLLVEHAGAASVRRWQKPGASHAAANLDEVAAASDVVLTGSAD